MDEAEFIASHETYHRGDLIIYQNGDRYEIGVIKSLREHGAFVTYSNGDTCAMTPYNCMHPITNQLFVKGFVQRMEQLGRETWGLNEDDEDWNK
jgi:hypothetical protein